MARIGVLCGDEQWEIAHSLLSGVHELVRFDGLPQLGRAAIDVLVALHDTLDGDRPLEAIAELADLPVVLVAGPGAEPVAFRRLRPALDDVLVAVADPWGQLPHRVGMALARGALRQRRRDAWEALREDLDEAHGALERQGEGVIILDETGRARFANAAARALVAVDPVGRVLRELELPEPGAAIRVPMRHNPGRVAELSWTETTWDGAPARQVRLRDVTLQERFRELVESLRGWTAGLLDDAASPEAAERFQALVEQVARDLDAPAVWLRWREDRDPWVYLGGPGRPGPVVGGEPVAACLLDGSPGSQVRDDPCRGCPAPLEQGMRCITVRAEEAPIGLGVAYPRDRDDVEVVVAVLELLLKDLLRVDAIWIARSEREALRERVATSERLEALGRLAAGVAHDFNNLLGVIHAASDLLAEGLPADHPGHPDLAAIRSAAASAARLTRRLLAFGRRQVGGRGPIELGEHLAGTADLLRRLAGEHVRLEVTPPREPVWVPLDPGDFEQILTNLVTNAVDAVDVGGRVRIAVRPVEGGRWAVLTVEDDGHGMDEETRRRIFEPFFTTKPRGVGTGLGLASVYGSVQAAGGRVEVTSAPGQGSRFDIFLPRLDAPERRSGGPAGPSAAAPERGGRVLLVEDHPSLRRLVARVLHRGGFEVQAVGSVQELRERLGEAGEAPDLLITDMVLPDGGGEDVVEAAAALAPGTRILLVSGYAPEGLGRRADLAQLPFLPKPFSPEQLLERVRSVLEAP